MRINKDKEMLWCSHGMWNHNAILSAFLSYNISVTWVQQKFSLKHKQNIYHLGSRDILILILLIFINSFL